jgi:hypothetical protein
MNNEKVSAIILTGSYRTFESIFPSIYTNLNLDKNILFLCFEMNDDKELYRYLESYPNVKIGKILTAPTFKTIEYTYILDMISTRPAVSEEVFKRAMEKDKSVGVNTYWSFDYLRCSGSIIQYYQFWKIWQYVIEYELVNNMKFDSIVRSRSDIFINKPVLEDMYNIVRNLHENNLLLTINDYYDELTDELVQKIGDPMHQEDKVITLGTEQVWIGKRHIFDKLSQIIFHYGLWDSGKEYAFNSETTFHMFCKKNGIIHIGIQECGWNVYYTLTDDKNTALFGISQV